MLNLLKTTTFTKKQSKKKDYIRAINSLGNINFLLIEDFA